MAGIVFSPTQTELVKDCLLPKVLGNGFSINNNNIKSGFNLYDVKQEWKKVFEEPGGHQRNNDVRYFFTELARKSRGGHRICRAIGDATWKEDSKVKIKDEINQDEIGYLTKFTYVKKKKAEEGGDGTRWLMNEYRLGGIYEELARTTNLVVCRITRKRPKVVAKYRHAHVEENNTPETNNMLTPATIEEANLFCSLQQCCKGGSQLVNGPLSSSQLEARHSYTTKVINSSGFSFGNMQGQSIGREFTTHDHRDKEVGASSAEQGEVLYEVDEGLQISAGDTNVTFCWDACMEM